MKTSSIIRFLAIAVIAMLCACGDSTGDEPKKPDAPQSEEVDEDPVLLDAVEGRVALAYCPYYTSKLPKADAVTHINYAFAEVYVRNGVYNGFKLQGKETTFKSVVDLKKENPKIKICLSFSHVVENSDNVQDGGFSAIAASDEYRKAFAADCLAFIQKWGIDGIDMDWEFPGMSWSGAACDPVNDVANHVLLMRQLRETLGTEYLLTFAGYCTDKRPTTDGAGMRYIDIAAVEPYVDYVCVMTYDFDAAPHFHSAMKSSSSYWDIERTIAAYKAAGFPMNKIVLGIPFYARHAWSGTNAAVDYRKLKSLGNGYKIDNWDATAQTPYITYNGAFWGSYDNTKSIRAKGDYARTNNLKGMFYWSASGDDDKYTLSRATWNSVMKQ